MTEGHGLHQQRPYLAAVCRHQSDGGAREIANVEYQLTPELARFPPTVIGGVISEYEVYRQRDPEQREWRQAVAPELKVKRFFRFDDHRCVQGEADDVGRNARHDRAARDEEQLRQSGAGTHYHQVADSTMGMEAKRSGGVARQFGRSNAVSLD